MQSGIGVPALTIDNVVRALEPLTEERIARTKFDIKHKWYYVGHCTLRLGDDLDNIVRTCTSDNGCLEKVVAFWLERCPYASWRWLIMRLDDFHQDVADQIRGYAEPLTDTSLTFENVLKAVESVSEHNLRLCFDISYHLMKRINKRHWRKKSKKKECVRWWLNSSPFASWGDLAGRLFFTGVEQETLHIARKYLQEGTTEPTMTLPNLDTDVYTELIRTNRYHSIYSLGTFLGIPYDEIEEKEEEGQSGDHALMQYYLDNHPAPSWRRIAYRHYLDSCFESVEIIQRKYLAQDINLQDICIKMISNCVKCEDVDSLPLPQKLKSLIKTNHHRIFT